MQSADERETVDGPAPSPHTHHQSQIETNCFTQGYIGDSERMEKQVPFTDN